MIPREHGSWPMLFIPPILGLAASEGGSAAVAFFFLLGSLGAFLARTPLTAMVCGREKGALPWLVGYSALAAAGFLPLLLAYGRWGLLLFALPAGAALLLNLRLAAAKKTMSLANELTGIWTLSLGAPAAYYAAGGTPEPGAWLLWLLNGAYFTGPVFHVKLCAFQHQAASNANALPLLEKARRRSWAYHCAALAGVLALAAAGAAHWLAAIPFAAALIKTLAQGARAPRRMDFRRVGYGEVGHSLVFASALLAAIYR